MGDEPRPHSLPMAPGCTGNRMHSVPEEGSSGWLPKSLLRYIKAGVSIFLSNLNCLKKSHHDKHNKLFYYKK